MSELMGTAEFAQRIGKTKDWVTREASAGRIPSRKIGRDRRFTEADLSAFLEAVRFVAADPLSQTRASRARRRRAS